MWLTADVSADGEVDYQLDGVSIAKRAPQTRISKPQLKSLSREYSSEIAEHIRRVDLFPQGPPRVMTMGWYVKPVDIEKERKHMKLDIFTGGHDTAYYLDNVQ